VAVNRLIRTGLRNAQLVSCVSQAVKNLLAERFKISPERLVVVHTAVGDHFRPVPPEIARRTLAQSYGIETTLRSVCGKTTSLQEHRSHP